MSTVTVPDLTTVEHTAAELAAVLRLLERMGANTIVLGSSRDESAKATRTALAAAWADRGGVVLDSVDWPETAASWLRQARRFAAPRPDAWVVSAQPAGWARMVRRLTDPAMEWTPRRTVVTASLRGPDVLAMGDAAAFAGLRGATREGRSWQIGRAPTCRGDVRRDLTHIASRLPVTTMSEASRAGGGQRQAWRRRSERWLWPSPHLFRQTSRFTLPTVVSPVLGHRFS